MRTNAKCHERECVYIVRDFDSDEYLLPLGGRTSLGWMAAEYKSRQEAMAACVRPNDKAVVRRIWT